jgi:thiol-disulfide isomerase/thioredoxin
MNRLRLPALAAVAITLLAACGSATSAESGAAPEAAPAAAVASAGAEPDSASAASQGPAASDIPAVSPDSLVPAVDVVDVRTGDTVNLGSVVPSDKPVLLWAWAPHCPSCRAEAGDLEKFAASNQDRLAVVGIGTQDDLDYARGFLEDTGVTTPLMLWNESFESWRTIGITAQPTWILLRGDGSFIDGWIGALPEDRILELLDA